MIVAFPDRPVVYVTGRSMGTGPTRRGFRTAFTASMMRSAREHEQDERDDRRRLEPARRGGACAPRSRRSRTSDQIVIDHHERHRDAGDPGRPPAAELPEPHREAEQRERREELVRGAEDRPEDLPCGDRASRGVRELHRDEQRGQERAWRASRRWRPPRPPAEQLLDDVAAEPRRDVERVVDERRERERRERDREVRMRTPSDFTKLPMPSA